MESTSVNRTPWTTWRGWAIYNATATLGMFIVALAIKRDLGYSAGMAGGIGIGMAVATAILGLMYVDDRN